ncbi:MAG: bifunctional diguanylate cyclase/phosphodiesterase [Pseudomonadota bacterium]
MIARSRNKISPLRHIRVVLSNMLTGPQSLAFLPAITLASFWLGGEVALIACALAVPIFVALIGAHDQVEQSLAKAPEALSDVNSRDRLLQALDDGMRAGGVGNRTSICFAVEINEFKSLEERYGRKAGELVLAKTAERIADSLRDYDVISQVDPATFGVAMAPIRQCDLEVAIQMAGRLQSSVERPVQIDATTVYVSSSIGFCLSSRAPSDQGASLLDAALVAMVEARRNGPSAIRAFTPEMRARIEARHTLMEEVSSALDAGDIHPWFQPQVSTETGRVTGFEALARWRHAERGLVSPAEFLPAIEQAGLMERLGEAMLYHALTALKAWDEAGVRVPSVGVNFSPDELRNPKLVDKVRWELDRFDVAPDRLCVEVLESVVANSDDDVVTRNIAGLANLGCQIDLDDFGTGHASISSIRRFSVSRIKIDRSFVMKVDEDPEQQRMIAAILMMAERLELETLAEGVETLGEHALLSQLGCGHVQGYGLARPMPFSDTINWIDRHEQKLAGASASITRPAQRGEPPQSGSAA